MRSRRRPRESIPTTAELPQLGETLRDRRLRQGLGVADAAAELGIPSGTLRAVEWDRLDLLGSPRDADRIMQRYAGFLGLEIGPVVADEEAEERPRARRAARALPLLVVAGLGSLIVITLLYALGALRGGDEEVQPNPKPQLGTTPRLSSTVSVPEASIPPPVEPAPTPVPKAPVQPPARLVLTAALGESWVEARAGSPAGPLLFRGTLASGRRLRLSGERLWVRLGAASNLALTLNGRRVGTELQGTVDVLVTPRGIRRA